MNNQYLAVRFTSGDPTSGTYDQLPLEVQEIDDPSVLPQDGQDWILMTYTSLDDYIARFRGRTEPLYPDPDPETVALNKVTAAKAFGDQLIMQAAAENIVLRLTPYQIIGMLTKLAPVVGMLQSGALTTAYITLQHVTPDASITRDRLDKYINAIRTYLGRNA